MQNDFRTRALTEFAQREDGPQPDPGAMWSRAAPLILDENQSAEDALVEALRNGLDHLKRNQQCVLDRAHEEGVHQMRVAARRLRSRLALYDDLIPADNRAVLQSPLKWLIGRLGPARDWDVFLLEVVTRATARSTGDADLARLVIAAEALRDRGYGRACKAQVSDRYRALEALLFRWAGERPWRTEALSDEQRAGLAEPVRAFADGIVEHRHDALLAKGAGFEAMAAEDRHRLRIEIKKVRYAAEFFGSLHSNERVHAYLEALKSLQDDLGAANDRVVARDLMMSLVNSARKSERVGLAFAAGIVIASQPAAASSEGESIALWHGFADGPTYWE